MTPRAHTTALRSPDWLPITWHLERRTWAQPDSGSKTPRRAETARRCATWAFYHAQTGDTDEALRWLGRAADADCDKAMYILGLCQASTTPPDLDDALRWYERAAEAGSSDAMYALAVMYMKKLKPRNKKMAKHWHGRAVEAGRPISPDLTYQVRTFMGAVRTAMKALG